MILEIAVPFLTKCEMKCHVLCEFRINQAKKKTFVNFFIVLLLFINVFRFQGTSF